MRRTMCILVLSFLATAMGGYAQMFPWFDPISRQLIGIPTNFPGNVTINATLPAGAPPGSVAANCVHSPGGPFNVVCYGAVSDDSTDNTAAINTAITAACAAATGGKAGGVVWFPKATKAYRILTSMLAPCSFLTLDFNGAKITYLGSDNALLITPDVDAQTVRVSGLKLSGTASMVAGIRITKGSGSYGPSRVLIEHCSIGSGPNAVGMRVDDNTPSLAARLNTFSGLRRGVETHDNTDGLLLEGNQYSSITDLATYTENGLGSGGMNIRGEVWGYAVVGGLQVVNGGEMEIAGNSFDVANGSATTTAGIDIVSCQRCHVYGNNINPNLNGPYGIVVEDTAQWALVEANTMTNHNTCGIKRSALANNIYRDNTAITYGNLYCGTFAGGTPQTLAVYTPTMDAVCSHAGDSTISGVTCGNASTDALFATTPASFATTYAMPANLLGATGNTLRIHTLWQVWLNSGAPAFLGTMNYDATLIYNTDAGANTLGGWAARGMSNSWQIIRGADATHLIAGTLTNPPWPDNTPRHGTNTVQQPVTVATTANARTISFTMGWNNDGMASGTYTSGITATGSVGQTCVLGSFNGAGGSGAAATVALTGTNAIAGGTALVPTNTGNSYTGVSTTATAANGTATCSGTATITTVRGGSQGNAMQLVAMTVEQIQ